MGRRCFWKHSRRHSERKPVRIRFCPPSAFREPSEDLLFLYKPQPIRSGSPEMVPGEIPQGIYGEQAQAALGAVSPRSNPQTRKVRILSSLPAAGTHSCMRVPFRPSYQSLTVGKTTPAVKPWPPGICRYSSMVEHLPSKQDTRVRFPLPAPGRKTSIVIQSIQERRRASDCYPGKQGRNHKNNTKEKAVFCCKPHSL